MRNRYEIMYEIVKFLYEKDGTFKSSAEWRASLVALIASKILKEPNKLSFEETFIEEDWYDQLMLDFEEHFPNQKKLYPVDRVLDIIQAIYNNYDLTRRV